MWKMDVNCKTNIVNVLIISLNSMTQIIVREFIKKFWNFKFKNKMNEVQLSEK